MGADGQGDGGKRRWLTTEHLTVLRIDGGVPYDVIEELEEDELLANWDEFTAYAEARDKASRESAGK